MLKKITHIILTLIFFFTLLVVFPYYVGSIASLQISHKLPIYINGVLFIAAFTIILIIATYKYYEFSKTDDTKGK